MPAWQSRAQSGPADWFHWVSDDAAPWTNDLSFTLYQADSQFGWVGNSYMFNAVGYPLRSLPRRSFGLDGVRFSSIRNTSQTVLFLDGCLYYGFDWHTTEYWQPHNAWYLWTHSILECG